MKRIFGLFMLVSMLAIPSMAFAAEQIGVYVAPKFIAGWTVMDGKTIWADGDDGGINSNIGSTTEGTFGGALAIGYDFNRKFNVPVRTELEYAVFSETKGSKNANIYGADDGSGGTFDGHWSAKQKMQIQTLFLNAYYDFHNSSAFTPYVGGGDRPQFFVPS